MVAFRTADIALEFAQAFVLDPGYVDIEIRSAIHVGPVLVHENDIYGLMVNKTQRLTGAAGDTPSIVVSDQAFPTIVSSLGKIGRQFFSAFKADLKGFEHERAWRFIKMEFDYLNKQRHEEIAKRRADPFRPGPVRPLRHNP
jgi:class 3 adenylate cyclase